MKTMNRYIPLVLSLSVLLTSATYAQSLPENNFSLNSALEAQNWINSHTDTTRQIAPQSSNDESVDYALPRKFSAEQESTRSYISKYNQADYPLLNDFLFPL